jgi:hypothetical protein
VRTVTCQLASLAAGGSVTIRVSATSGGRGTVAATAQVSGSPGDPNPSNDTATATVTIR